MKIQQISPNIWKLSVWMLIPVSVWVVRGKEGVTLIDGGMPMMAGGIRKFIEQLNAGPLCKILLTHGHSDHVGSIEKIRSKHAFDVFAHPLEIPYVEGKQPYPQRPKATELIKPGIVKPLKQSNGMMEKVGDLQPYHTPGHSPGHVVYYHYIDQIMIGGDLFTSNARGLKRPYPIFTPDMKQAIKSGKIVKDVKPQLISVCHGVDVMNPHEQYDAYAQKWLA